MGVLRHGIKANPRRQQHEQIDDSVPLCVWFHAKVAKGNSRFGTGMVSSPSPQPSPSGRGCPFGRFGKIRTAAENQKRRSGLPLPRGEGRGEGEANSRWAMTHRFEN